MKYAIIKRLNIMYYCR